MKTMWFMRGTKPFHLYMSRFLPVIPAGYHAALEELARTLDNSSIY